MSLIQLNIQISKLHDSHANKGTKIYSYQSNVDQLKCLHMLHLPPKATQLQLHSTPILYALKLPHDHSMNYLHLCRLDLVQQPSPKQRMDLQGM